MSNFTQGILLALTYNLLTATKGVFLGSLLQGTDPILILFCTFSIVAIFFNVLKFVRREEEGRNQEPGGVDLLMVNILTAFAWMTFYYAVKNMEPAVATALANCLGPIITLIVAYRLNTGAKPINLEIVAAIGVVLSMVGLISVAWFGKSGLGSLSISQAALGLTMAIVCGISMAFNNIFSKRLNQKKWSAQKILSSRFYILLGVSFVMLRPESLSWFSSPSNYFYLGVISFLGVIVPLFAFQKSLEKLEPIFVSLVLATSPLIAFVLQRLDKRIDFSFWSLIGIAAVVSFSCMGVLARFRAQRIEHVRLEKKCA